MIEHKNNCTTFLLFDTTKERPPYTLKRITMIIGLASQLTEEQAKEIVISKDTPLSIWLSKNELTALCRSHGIEPENCLILKMK